MHHSLSRADIDRVIATQLHYVRKPIREGNTSLCGLEGNYLPSDGGANHSGAPTLCPLCRMVYDQMQP